MISAYIGVQGECVYLLCDLCKCVFMCVWNNWDVACQGNTSIFIFFFFFFKQASQSETIMGVPA